MRAIALRYGHPRWLVKRYHPEGGDNARIRCEANNQPAPLTIRFRPNCSEAGLASLKEDGAQVVAGQWSSSGYYWKIILTPSKVRL